MPADAVGRERRALPFEGRRFARDSRQVLGPRPGLRQHGLAPRIDRRRLGALLEHGAALVETSAGCNRLEPLGLGFRGAPGLGLVVPVELVQLRARGAQRAGRAQGAVERGVFGLGPDGGLFRGREVLLMRGQALGGRVAVVRQRQLLQQELRLRARVGRLAVDDAVHALVDVEAEQRTRILRRSSGLPFRNASNWPWGSTTERVKPS